LEQTVSDPTNTETAKAVSLEAAKEQTRVYHDHYMDRLFTMLNEYGAMGASDIHFLPDDGTYPVVSGIPKKDPRPESVLVQSEILEWLRRPGELGVATDAILGERGHVSKAFHTGTYRTRASFRRTTNGVSVTFRLIPLEVPTADEAGVPPQFQELMNQRAGLLLIEGPTGSGKSTASAGLTKKFNIEREGHVYLIEDPVEFIHVPIGNTVFTQREIGEHALDYATAVENALRSAPNLVIVGELLDPPTTKAALHAATTGHLVITTAHAGSITEAIESFVGKFTAAEQPEIRSRLAQSLLGIMVQKLVPKIGGGRIAAREILIMNRSFQDLIRDETKANLIHQQLQSSKGCFSLEDDLVRLVREGAITEDTAFNEARDLEAIKDGLERIQAEQSKTGARR
jgi:twitching motility protein PilT